MSGGFVPYHLRPNKAVDRHLFVELLTKINRYAPISKYTYVGFGGSFLEDFKLVHNTFGNKKMISIEGDPNVMRRQKFNLPLRCIERRNEKSGDFIASYSIEGQAVIWLDYASPREIRIQVEEFESLIAKLQTHDILKITVNANPETLRARDSIDDSGRRETAGVRNEKRLAKLSARLGDYLPQEASAEMMTLDELPKLLCRALEFDANNALKGSRSETFQDLTSFVYSDLSHQMLTVTGMILQKSEVRNFLKETDIRRWELSSLDYRTVRRIRVPELTAREKLFIDRYLPASSEKLIHKRLDFLFDDDEEISLQILKGYTDFYRFYPNFQKVIF